MFSRIESPEEEVSSLVPELSAARACLPDLAASIPRCERQHVWEVTGGVQASREESNAMSGDVYALGCDVFTHCDEDFRRVRRREQNRRAAQRCRARRKLREVTLTQETQQELVRMACLQQEAYLLTSQNQALRQTLRQHGLWVPGADYSHHPARGRHPTSPPAPGTEVRELLRKVENHAAIEEQQ